MKDKKWFYTYTLYLREKGALILLDVKGLRYISRWTYTERFCGIDRFSLLKRKMAMCDKRHNSKTSTIDVVILICWNKTVRCTYSADAADTYCILITLLFKMSLVCSETINVIL